MTWLSILIRLVIAVAIAAFADKYFAAVLPNIAAIAIAIGVALAELVGPAFAGKNGSGGGLRVLARCGAALVVWPGIAWLLELAGLADRDSRIAIAAACACGVGVLAAGHGQGRDNARLVTVIIAAAIPAYALLVAINGGSMLSVALGCLAVAVAPLTAQAAHVWPDAHKSKMMMASAVAVAAAVVAAARIFV